MAEQERQRGFADQLGRLGPVLRDLGQVDVRDEVVGVGAAEDHDLARVVALGMLDQRDEVADERCPEEVHRRASMSTKTTPRSIWTLSVSNLQDPHAAELVAVVTG
jgi:hypothetical protein